MKTIIELPELTEKLTGDQLRDICAIVYPGCSLTYKDNGVKVLYSLEKSDFAPEVLRPVFNHDDLDHDLEDRRVRYNVPSEVIGWGEGL